MGASRLRRAAEGKARSGAGSPCTYRGRRGNLPFRRAARIRDHSVGTRYRPHSAGARRVGCVRPRRGGGNESPGRVRRDGAPRGRRDPRRSPGDPGPAARRDDGVQPPAPRKGPHVSGDGRAADPRDRGRSTADSRAPPREARRDGSEARPRSRGSEAIAVLGVTQLSRRDLESIVDEVLRASQDLIASRGDAAEKALMGQVMKRVRGRADGKLVSEVLHERLETHLTEKPKGRKKKR